MLSRWSVVNPISLIFRIKTRAWAIVDHPFIFTYNYEDKPVLTREGSHYRCNWRIRCKLVYFRNPVCYWWGANWFRWYKRCLQKSKNFLLLLFLFFVKLTRFSSQKKSSQVSITEGLSRVEVCQSPLFTMVNSDHNYRRTVIRFAYWSRKRRQMTFSTRETANQRVLVKWVDSWPKYPFERNNAHRKIQQ